MMPAPRSRSADKRYYGVAIGLVTDNLDPEKLGRVKVKFPWFDEAMDSEWCRIANVYAGGGYGSFWIPELDDEVLVAFEHGDMRFPFVIGGLYNGVDNPPSDRSDAKNQKLFRTKGEHQVLLDDSPGDERIKITTKKGNTADLSDADQSITIKTKGGHTITLDDLAREVTVKSSGGQSLKMDAGGAVTVKGVSQVTLDAAKINIGAGASFSLVLGEALMTLFNAHVHTCTAPATPSSPPVTPMTPAVLSTTNKTS